MSPPAPPPVGHRFVDQGAVLLAGPTGSPSARLSGMISPTRVWQEAGALWMEFVGADGDRPDGGPAHRRLLRSRSDDDGASWSPPVVVQEWSTNDPISLEAGIFSGSPSYFSAVTAADSTTDSVWSDVRRRSDNSLVLDHADSNVWGHGDELFIHSELQDGSLLYIAKGGDVRWGLGRRYADGRTEQVLGDGEQVFGGGAYGGYVVLVRDHALSGSRIEWYDETDLSRPIHVSVCGARQVTPYWDGARWRLYGRTPEDGEEIRCWRLEDASWPPAHTTDELDLSTVIWLHANISGWTASSKVTGVSIQNSGPVCIRHTKAGQWPVVVIDGTAVEGNPWVFAQIGGQWYGATFEHLRPGQECKGEVTQTNIGPHTKRRPLSDWVPQSGELVGFAMSTPARNAPRTSNERSNVVLVTWP